MPRINQRTLSAACFCAAFGCVSNTMARSEEITEEVIVIGEQQPYFEKSRSTALKFPVDDLNTPFSTSVINATILEDLKANTLEDAYSYISGFSRSGTSANSFTIRGQSSDLQNLQVDGLPGLVSRFGSPVTANIERVEVLKGPASVLYGWMDPGGLVNIITKKPQVETNTKIDFTAQQFAQYGEGGFEGSLDTTGAFGENQNLLYRLIIGGETSDSFRDFVESDSIYLFPSISWLIDDVSRLDVQLEYTKEQRSADNGLWVLNQDISTIADIETYYQEPGDFDNDEGFGLSFSYRREINERLHSNVRWRSVWHEDERDLYESNSLIVVDGETLLRRRNRHQENERQYHFFDANLTYSFGETIQQDVLIGINGGYEYRQFDRLAFADRGEAGFISLNDPQYTGDVLEDIPGNFRQWDLASAGAYLMDRITFNKHWSVLVGARVDSQSGDYQERFIDESGEDRDENETVSNVSGNAGVVYQFNPHFSTYASFGESFNPQSIPTFDVNDNQLDPEEGQQWEAGFKLTSFQGRFNVNAAYFDIKKNNIAEVGDTGFDELIGEVSSQGIEINIQAQPTPNLQLLFGYSYTEAEISDAEEDAADTLGNPPGFAPRNSAFFISRYNYPNQIFGGLVGASLGIEYEDERFTDEETSRRVLLPSHQVVDFAFYYEVNQAKYALNIDNLLDEEYFVGGTNNTRIYPGEPRKISISASLNF